MFRSLFHLFQLWPSGRKTFRLSRRKPAKVQLTIEALDGRDLPSVLATAGNLGDAALVGALNSSTIQQQMHVDGGYQLDLVNANGSHVTAHADGYLYLDNMPGLHFTLDAAVKGTGNAVEGTPTMVFDDGSTLTFAYKVRQIKGTDLFEGDYQIIGGTGQFAGATGSGEICYPVDGTGSGPLMMDGTLIR
jgi:hypothetical protein